MSENMRIFWQAVGYVIAAASLVWFLWAPALKRDTPEKAFALGLACYGVILSVILLMVRAFSPPEINGFSPAATTFFSWLLTLSLTYIAYFYAMYLTLRARLPEEKRPSDII